MKSGIGMLRAAALAAGVLALGDAAGATGCAGDGSGLGVSRVVEIDTASGPLYGDITKFAKETSILEPKEVVLTFDDGPLPGVTRSILDTLDRYCTKATFFSIGRMAIAYPASVQEVLARGHTVGTHTWSHPINLKRLKPEAARDEVERGFAAVSLAAGQPIAPFFRFPGLNDSSDLLAHLQGRGVATFTVDVVSNDSYIHDTGRLIQATLAKVESRQGGILLFHDIKAATARALPAILSELGARGYKVVHLRAKRGFEPQPALTEQLRPMLAKAQTGRSQLTPFYAGMIALRTPDGAGEPPVTALAPQPKSFDVGASDRRDGEPRPRKPRQRSERSEPTPTTSGWATTVRRLRKASMEDAEHDPSRR